MGLGHHLQALKSMTLGYKTLTAFYAVLIVVWAVT